MDHLLLPLDRLRARAAAFLRNDPCPLLLVQTDQELGNDAVKTLLALEYHPDNVRNAVLLDGDARGTRAPWSMWTETLPVVYAAIRKAHDLDGSTGESKYLGEGDEVAPSPSLSRDAALFSVKLRQLLSVLTSPPFSLDGLLIVVSISGEYDKTAFADELAVLLEMPSLASVRWVWVESFETSPPGRLQGRSESCLVEVDPDAAAAFQKAALSSIDGPVPIVGEAWPDLLAPWHPSQPRVDQAPPGSPNPVIATALLKAAKALNERQNSVAIDLLRGARDTAFGTNQVVLGLELELLANVSRAQQGGQELSKAMGELGRTAERARDERLWLTAAKVETALAGLASSVQDYALSAISYRKAANAAREGSFVSLAVEALYLGGEIALAGAQLLKIAALEHTAADVWHEAFDLAAEMAPGEVAGSRLEGLGGRLATLLRRQGLISEAAEIEARVAEILDAQRLSAN